MDQTIQKVYNTIKVNNLISQGDKIILGLSGGADSVFLFYVLLELQKHLNFTFSCAHLNHKIRGDDAISDQKFCTNLCKKNNISIFTCEKDIPLISKQEKISEEACGRNERYKFFNDICERYIYNKIATAHNMNDNVETIIFNLIRGASLRGISGIEYRKDKIIRPILDVLRTDIEEYLKKNKFEYCTDATNFKYDYTRNKIRHKILPELHTINSKVTETIHVNAHNFREDNNFLDNYVDSLRCIHKQNDSVYVEKNIFENQHISIKKRIVLRAFYELIGNTLNICSNHITILMNNLQSGKMYNMPNNVNVYYTSKYLVFTKKIFEKKEIIQTFLPGKAISFGDSLVITSSFCNEMNPNEKNVVYINYDNLDQCNLYVRNKRDGDRFIPYGMKQSKKLKDFFVNLKIPIDERYSIPLLCNDKDIIAVIPYRVSDSYKVNTDTKKILKIQIFKGEKL